MYQRPIFKIDDPEREWEVAAEIALESPLALMISTSADGRVEINHAPLLFDGQEKKLLGHLAANNPHTKIIREGGAVTAVFTCGNSYVSPNWMYVPDVPTWNYATVHMSGRFAPHATFDEARALLKRQSDAMEARFNKENFWKFHIPDRDPVAALTKGILAFSIALDSLSVKLKMSQNKTPEDKAAVIAALETRAPDTARWMKRS